MRALFLVLLATACNDAGSPEAVVHASGECSPDGDIPCYAGKAEPCDDFHTGWSGDEFCLKPPEVGYQIHVGPTDYDNPDDVDKWVLGAGAGDVNWCVQMKTPNDETFYSSGYYSHMRPGSHHQIIFALPGADLPDSTEPGSCGARDGGVLGGSYFISGATRSVQDAAMFGNAPEDEHIAAETPPHLQVSVNLHFVNIFDHDLLQEIWVNMIPYEKDPSTIEEKIKAITWYGGLGMNIPPGQKSLEGGSDCHAPLDLRILGLTAHAHASTARVSTYVTPSGSSEEQLLWEDYNWSEPTVFRYNSTTDNARPDAAAKIAGSLKSGILHVGPGDAFRWECEVVNNRSVTLTFSDKAYDGEMCNVFGMYSAPTAPSPWSCTGL
jgi:hypothetical protein